jgi:hypothetical protein
VEQIEVFSVAPVDSPKEAVSAQIDRRLAIAMRIMLGVPAGD